MADTRLELAGEPGGTSDDGGIVPSRWPAISNSSSVGRSGVGEQAGTKATEKNRYAKLFPRRIERVCFDVDEGISAQLTERSDVDSTLDEIRRRIRR